MKAIIIKTAAIPGREPQEQPGWLVDNTEGLLAIDMRYEADIEAIPPSPAGWIITHLPTGARVGYGEYTSASTKDVAASIAKRFYDEFKSRGWNLYSDQPEVVVASVQKLEPVERTQFWETVAGWPKKSADTSTASQEK